MQRTLNRNIGTYLLYVILITVFAIGLNVGLKWILNNWILDILNWFNGRSFIWKLVIVLLGGFIVVGMAWGILQMIGTFLGMIIFNRFPKTKFTYVFSMVLFICGSIYMIIQLWKIVFNWSGWVVIEFVILCAFIITTNYLPVNLSKKDEDEV